MSFDKAVVIVIMLLCLLPHLTTTAQSGRAWEQALQAIMPVSDEEAAQWEDVCDLLCELEENPIDLNTATHEDLEVLPFLSDKQIEGIMEYLFRYGPMKTFNELRMITALDPLQIELLPYFVTLGNQTEEQVFPDMERIARYGHHELMGHVQVPLYQRKGDSDGYLGYPLKHWLRYQFSFGDYVKAGLVGSQDAGEPFLADKNRLGYDFYSLYFQVKHFRRLDNIVLGKYRLQAGMGLVLNNSFSLGKTTMLQSLGRTATVLRTHSSRSQANYMQGAAAVVNTGHNTSLMVFGSYCPIDATLNNDGTAATILDNGYHRTPTEMEKKGNTHAAATGAHLSYRHGRFHTGLTAVYTHLDRRLMPKKALYRRHYAKGNDFVNVGADYGYTAYRLTFNGETAVNGDGALATINSLSLRLSSELSLSALQRFFSYRYTSLYANAFREGSQVQNESGIYVGAVWQPSPKLRLQAYTDYAYFPWPRYQISQSSEAWDNFVAATYSYRGWTLMGRYRLHLRQRDNEEKTTLLSRREHRARLSLNRRWNASLSTTTQADFTRCDFTQTDQGYSLSQQVAYQRGPLRLNLSMAWFDTDSYDSRVYLYERSPLYNFSFPALAGEGIRYAMMAQLNLGQQLSVTAKATVTDYFDRSVIGTGLQQIDASSQADLYFQLRWKF